MSENNPAFGPDWGDINNLKLSIEEGKIEFAKLCALIQGLQQATGRQEKEIQNLASSVRALQGVSGERAAFEQWWKKRGEELFAIRTGKELAWEAWNASLICKEVGYNP